MTEILDWLLEAGRQSDDLGAIIAGACHRLVAAGVAIRRVNLTFPTIDPTAAARRHLWSAEKGVKSEALSPEQTWGAAYRQSPICHLVEGNIRAAQWSLDDPEAVRKFPLLAELRAEGMTEYAIRFLPFGKGRTALQGVVLTVATDRAGGFAAAELAAIDRILPALAIVAYRIALSDVAAETLGAYLGAQTAPRVLQGMIRRGESQVISAALLLADLRGFTALVDRAGGVEVVRWLNEHLDCIGEAVTERGGEVLKFLGDGLLAVFPAEAGGAERACAEALASALDACARNRALNARRAEAGGPTLEVSVALHFGDVVYGNIGMARRLDFTVVGPAVNEVSRMEALAKSLGRELLLSATVAERCGQLVTSLGPHTLRGVAGVREMYMPAPASAD